MREHKGYFEVACCKKRRGLIGGVLVCSVCDFTSASVMPNERHAKDVPADAWFVYVDRKSA